MILFRLWFRLFRRASWTMRLAMSILMGIMGVVLGLVVHHFVLVPGDLLIFGTAGAGAWAVLYFCYYMDGH